MTNFDETSSPQIPFFSLCISSLGTILTHVLLANQIKTVPTITNASTPLVLFARPPEPEEVQPGHDIPRGMERTTTKEDWLRTL